MVCHLAIEVELNRVGSLEHTVSMELTLRRGGVTVHHALVLLALLRIASLRRVRVTHQVLRVVTLGLENIGFTDTRPATQFLLATGSPERRPGRPRARKLDARFDIETTSRRSIQHSTIGLLRGDHARRKRRIVHSAAVLTSTRDLRTVPLSLRGRVPRS